MVVIPQLHFGITHFKERGDKITLTKRNNAIETQA